MKLSALKSFLENSSELHLIQADGQSVPAHFHITEAGLNTKHFVDCGGTERLEKNISMQVWVASDKDHRLTPAKLSGILQKAELLFGGEDLEVEVEYQTDTIGRYGLKQDGNFLTLTSKRTQCLALDLCLPSPEKIYKDLKNLVPATGCCTPSSGCC